MHSACFLFLLEYKYIYNLNRSAPSPQIPGEESAMSESNPLKLSRTAMWQQTGMPSVIRKGLRPAVSALNAGMFHVWPEASCFQSLRFLIWKVGDVVVRVIKVWLCLECPGLVLTQQVPGEHPLWFLILSCKPASTSMAPSHHLTATPWPAVPPALCPVALPGGPTVSSELLVMLPGQVSLGSLGCF